MSDTILRYVRITNSGKLSDRYVSTQVKESSDPDRRDYGRLFTIVEITNPWHTSAQLGQTIINIASREYFKANDEDPLARFETALRKVNETLATLANSGETDLPEQLHALLALSVGDQIHLASCGQVRGWLIRDGKGSAVIESSTSTAGKIFSAVISGTFEPGDRLLLASSGILQILNQTELATNIFAPKELAASAIRLANVLKAKRGQWVNAVLLEYQTASVAANAPAYTLPDTLYLDSGSTTDWRTTVRTLTMQSRTGLITAGSYVRTGYRAASQFFRDSLLPRSRQAWQKTHAWSQAQIEQFQSKTLPALKTTAGTLRGKIEEARQTRPSTPTQPPTQLTKESLIGKSVFAIHDYQQGHRQTDGDPSPSLPIVATPELDDDDVVPEGVRHYRAPTLSASPFNAPRSVHFRIPKVQFRFPSVSIPKNFPSDRRSLGIIAIGIVLLILLANNLWALRSNRSNELSRTQAAQQLLELQDQLEEAKLAKIFNQSDKALAAAQAVVDGSRALESSPLADDGTEIASVAQGVIDELTSTKRLTNLTELGAVDGSYLALWQDRITALQSNGGLVTYPTGGGESASLDVPNSERITDVAAFDGKDGIAVLTSAPVVYETSQASGPLSPITLSGGSWQNGSALAAFLGNLYTLSPSQNKIWKYTASNGTLGESQSYVSDDTDVGQGIDLAIDGNVYVLAKSGEIIKLNRGKRVELGVRDIPKPDSSFTQPKQIEAAGEKLYVLDANRIVKLSSDGRFEEQYALANNEAIRSFAIKDKTLFILTDTRLVKTEL